MAEHLSDIHRFSNTGDSEGVRRCISAGSAAVNSIDNVSYIFISLLINNTSVEP